jgi:hypothetical protein
MVWLKNLFKGVAVVIGSFLFVGIAITAGSEIIALGAAIAVSLLAVITTIRPMPKIWVSNRITAVALLIVASISMLATIGLIQNNNKAKLAALRLSNPTEYLKIIKSKIDDQSYLLELKDLDPAAFQNELERRSADEQAKQQRIMDTHLKTLADLKIKISTAATLPLNEQLELYNQLADLDPASENYKRERDRLKIVFEAEEEKKRKAKAESIRLERAQSNPEEFLEIKKLSWWKGGFGSIMMATFVVKSTSPFDIKDIAIHCTDLAPSGTVVDVNDRTIYEIVKANGTKTFREINMGFIHSQASNTSCQIRSATSMY